MKNMLENIDSVLTEHLDEEVIKRAAELDFDSCEHWQSITDEQIAEMSQEEYDDLKIWTDACMVFNLRFSIHCLVDGFEDHATASEGDEQTLKKGSQTFRFAMAPRVVSVCRLFGVEDGP